MVGAQVAESAIEPGDLLYYSGLGHVAMYVGNGMISDVPAGKQILVSDFVISVHQGVLTAEVNGNSKTRVPLLRFGGFA